jgi:hypothetical protein
MIDFSRQLELIQKRSNVMKTEDKWSFRSLAGKSMAGLALAAILGGIYVTPAIAKDDHKRIERHDNRNDHRARGYDRDHYYVHGRRVYRPQVYRERVYVPPPVYYAPPPPPGVSVFLPPFFIHL